MIFHNVGSKIKTISELFCYIGIILAVLLFGFFAITISWIYLLYMVGACLVIFISSLSLNALGVLVENSDRQRRLLEGIYRNTKCEQKYFNSNEDFD